jgi:hypothetical protein
LANSTGMMKLFGQKHEVLTREDIDAGFDGQ